MQTHLFAFLVAIFFKFHINKLVKLATSVKSGPRAPFSIATAPMCRGGRYPRITPFTLNPNRIMLRDKQGGITYQFLSLLYDSTWDLTPVFWTISEHYSFGQWRGHQHTHTYTHSYTHIKMHEYTYIYIYIYRLWPLWTISNVFSFQIFKGA